MGEDSIFINGEKYVRASFMGKLEGIFLDYFHIILHRKEVEVKGKKCFMCGLTFVPKELTKHHAIPKKLRSIFNIHIPFCKECHKKFNKFIGSPKTNKEKKQ